MSRIFHMGLCEWEPLKMVVNPFVSSCQTTLNRGATFVIHVCGMSFFKTGTRFRCFKGKQRKPPLGSPILRPEWYPQAKKIPACASVSQSGGLGANHNLKPVDEFGRFTSGRAWAGRRAVAAGWPRGPARLVATRWNPLGNSPFSLFWGCPLWL